MKAKKVSKPKTHNPYSHLYQIIADEALIGLITFNLSNHQVVYVNRLGMELLAVPSLGDLQTFTLGSLYPPPDSRNPRAFGDQWILADGLYQDMIVRRFSGQTLVANLGVKNLNIEGAPHLLLMIQDITLQKKLQREVQEKQQAIVLAYKELLEQNKKLRELDLAKTRFTALTTHELRTPVSAMAGAAEILKLKLYDTDEQLAEFVDIVYEQGKQLSALVNDILDFSKIQAGKMEYYVQEMDVGPVVKSIAEGLNTVAAGNQIQIHFDSPTQEMKCYFDDMRLKQVLANIMSNALKYNKPQGTVSITISQDESWTRVYVKDSGIGIAPEDLTKVFDEFETLGKVSQHHKGTGLGMPISLRLMTGIGGKIHLESEVGVGTTFWIEIPRTRILDDEVYRARPSQSDDLAA